jgi:hypothetical protein
MTTSARALDHTVQVVGDLESARADYERLGFRAMPKVIHPSGATANYLFQLDGSFLEIIAIVDPSKVVASTSEQFSFAEHNRDFAARRGEGLSLMALSTDDAVRDYTRCQTADLRGYPPFHFKRRAEGNNVPGSEVAFTLAFLVDQRLPDMSLFFFQQHTPENFWQPSYMVHPNGAQGIAELVVIADAPRSLERHFSAVLGAAPNAVSVEALEFLTARSRVLILTENAYSERFGEGAARRSSSPWFASVAVRVASLQEVENRLRQASIEFRAIKGERLRVADRHTHGLTLDFVES